MALGVRYELGNIDAGDTAELYAAIQNTGVPITQSEIASVEYTIQKPSGVLLGPFEGEIEEDGRGFYRYEATTEPGEYEVRARFTLLTGEVRSAMLDFTVIDPFDTTPPSLEEIVIDSVWTRLEDSFDSVTGGPWLRDETRASFDKSKFSHYIGETLLDINVQMPPTHATIADFATPGPFGEPNELLALLTKGVLCRVIMHLVRSYVEQPVPQGAQIVYEDRTRYKDAWMAVYEKEHTDFYTMVRLWKRQLLRLGHSALLVHSKAGRLYYGTTQRTRNISRGFY